ncbi:hypothetical protein INS49_015497 [Diaporthe citri]|uniref:uncharacterized protein n=1 Tax=Diaporthe citri TaxID=83186 RepID=UPI001C7F6439|nr:uncharacterized protein INS49_015497 [Diaporthe citri]KAG6356112.1 hypothetical protein INS49_015497 [Diaporthe citri]
MDQRHRWMVHGKLEKKALLVAINSLAGLSIFFFGYDQGMMGGVNESRDYIDLMGLGHVTDEGNPVITDTLLQGGIMCVYYLGTLLGCLMGGSLGDGYGRIKAIGAGALWGILVHTEHIGVVVAYWLGYAVRFIDNGNSPVRWRFPIAFQIIPLLFLLVGCWLFPESPRWLARVGRDDEALYILQRLRETTGPDAGLAEAELANIKGVVQLEKKTDGTSYIAMLFGLRSGKLHTARRVQLVIWLQIMQCWTGIAGVTMYGPTIFSIAGFNSDKSQWVSGLNNITYTFATLVCAFTIDRIGRRWTLYWGSVGQGIAMFLVGGLSRAGLDARAQGNIDTANQWGATAASFVFVYTFIFGATWLTVPWLYPAEIFPLQVRAKGNSFGVVGWSIGNGTLTLVLPYIVSAISEKMMYIFGAVNIISIPIAHTGRDGLALRAADTPWAWDAEKTFAMLKEQNPGLGGAARHDGREYLEAKVADAAMTHHE